MTTPPRWNCAPRNNHSRQAEKKKANRNSGSFHVSVFHMHCSCPHQHRGHSQTHAPETVNSEDHRNHLAEHFHPTKRRFLPYSLLMEFLCRSPRNENMYPTHKDFLLHRILIFLLDFCNQQVSYSKDNHWLLFLSIRKITSGYLICITDS